MLLAPLNDSEYLHASKRAMKFLLVVLLTSIFVLNKITHIYRWVLQFCQAQMVHNLTIQTFHCRLVRL